ncbi:hypothetical protein [Microbacterium sp. B19]|uniref:hypothetical protein n=1 Tax=Microbacterium sp. B19 TaxID=96765 RepID=UPI000345FF6B|nr:hypothetical protein [Microbacterium sp. B19]
MGDDGYDAIVTFDRQQMKNHAERKAVFDADLHWIGLRMNAPEGPGGIAWLSSSMLAALPHLLDHRAEEPQVFRLKGAPNQQTQVMTTTPVWNTQLDRIYGTT